MKNIIIELTDQDDTKIMLNVTRIELIEPNKNGTSIRIVNYSLAKKVKESYDQVKSIIRSLDS
jgi:hypothetical protein